MSNSFVIGWSLDKHRAHKLRAFGLKANQAPPLERTELVGFCVLGRTPHVSSGPTWAARKKTCAGFHPALRAAAFLPGTAQVWLSMVRQATKRLNGFLRGLWTPVGRGVKALAYHPWATYS